MILIRKIITSLLFTGLTFALYAQPDVLITDGDYTASGPNGDCACSTDFNNGSIQNFHDSGGSGANYSPSENEVITFCPDATGSKVVAAFGINAGYSFDVDPSDTIYIYDGPNTSAPLLAKLNNTLTPNGGNYPASWSNLSGCLTIQFVSDGMNEGTGWDANISCSNLAQPFRGGMEAFINGVANGSNDNVDDLNPSDTGYVDVCFGDSVMFVATPYFPYEPGGDSAALNGGGYDQTNNHTSSWTFSDGTQLTGDTVWFVPPARQGYFVTLKVEDSYGIFVYTLSKVRVSTIPSFATCRPLNDSLCFGEQTELVGGVSAIDTAGVDPTTINFPIGGVFGAQTYLPDGSGLNYTTDIDISGFTSGGTVQNASDIEKICVSIEHSYLGDLEMMLTCPNGQSVNIFNSYTGNGLFSGGFGGGGTYLGGAYDNNTGTIGVCEEYCFSNQSGALPSWNNGYPTTTATGPSSGSMVTPGTYNPEEAFVPALQGCPINGTWTLTVRDNLSIDDGYICEWGIYFNDSLNPNSEFYAPLIVSDFWHPTSDIVLDDDTTLLVQPDSMGTNHYTFEVLDSYGCSYDTTITVEVLPLPSISPDTTIACDGESIQFSNTSAFQGGVWWGVGNGTMTFSPSNTDMNPSVSVDVNGVYQVYFKDNQCNDTVQTTLNFFDEPTTSILYEGVQVDSIAICSDDEIVINTQSTDAATYLWNLGGGTADSLVFDASSMAFTTTPAYFEYLFEATGLCGVVYDSVVVEVEDCELPNVITPNGDGINDYFYTNFANHYSDVQLTIYNRWGRVVFKTDSYQNDWNGVNMHGKQVSSGTYYYVVSYDGGTKGSAGTVTIFDGR